MNKKLLPYISLLICNALWGINAVVIKLTLPHIPVMTILFLRFFVAGLILLPFLLKTKPHLNFKKEHLFTLVLAGFFTIAISNAFTYVGLIYTTAINMSLIGIAGPLFGILIGIWFFKERVHKLNILGSLLGVLGTCIVINTSLLSLHLITNYSLGNTLVLLANIIGAVGILLSKKLFSYYSPLVITATGFIIGAITFAIPAFMDITQSPSYLPHIGISGLLGIIFIVLFPTLICYLLMIWAINKVPVSQAAIFYYLQPLFTITLAIPVLHEKLTVPMVIGGALIILGLVLGTTNKKYHIFHRHHF